MSKIKEIEELRKVRKAREDRAALKEEETKTAQAISMGDGLRLALNILRRPSNTRRHMDAKYCTCTEHTGLVKKLDHVCATCFKPRQ